MIVTKVFTCKLMVMEHDGKAHTYEDDDDDDEEEGATGGDGGIIG